MKLKLKTKDIKEGMNMSTGSLHYIKFPTMNMDLLPFYEAKVLFSEGRGRM